MNLKTFIPHSSLSQYIKFYWLLEIDEELKQPQRLLPSICTDIIIHIGPHSNYSIKDDEWKLRQPVGFVEGLFKSYFLIRFNGKSRLIGIRFKSTGLYPFIKTPLDQFTEKFIDINDVFQHTGNELIEQLAFETSDDNIRNCLDRFLIKQLNYIESSSKVEQAVRLLIKGNGIVSINHVQKKVSLSERQLERNFKRFIGITPEQFASRLRMKHFINLVKSSNLYSFTQLAYICGYYDQSHLIHSFKKHTGLTPKRYFIQHHDIQTALNQG